MADHEQIVVIGTTVDSSSPMFKLNIGISKARKGIENLPTDEKNRFETQLSSIENTSKQDNPLSKVYAIKEFNDLLHKIKQTVVSKDLSMSSELQDMRAIEVPKEDELKKEEQKTEEKKEEKEEQKTEEEKPEFKKMEAPTEKKEEKKKKGDTLKKIKNIAGIGLLGSAGILGYLNLQHQKDKEKEAQKREQEELDRINGILSTNPNDQSAHAERARIMEQRRDRIKTMLMEKGIKSIEDAFKNEENKKFDIGRSPQKIADFFSGNTSKQYSMPSVTDRLLNETAYKLRNYR